MSAEEELKKATDLIESDYQRIYEGWIPAVMVAATLVGWFVGKDNFWWGLAATIGTVVVCRIIQTIAFLRCMKRRHADYAATFVASIAALPDIKVTQHSAEVVGRLGDQVAYEWIEVGDGEVSAHLKFDSFVGHSFKVPEGQFFIYDGVLYAEPAQTPAPVLTV